MKYKLAQDTIPTEDIDKLSAFLQSYPPLTIVAGDVTKKLEKEWSEKIGVKYSVFCNSGSSANLLAYAALLNISSSLKGRRSTALSTSGWITTMSPILQLGLTPILCEVDKNTFGIDISYLDYLFKDIRRTPLLVVLVHTLGIPNNMDKILELQRKYNFLLMEDCCPAVGSKYQNKHVGTFGDIGTFSFYYGHQLSTIEGGMVCTNRKDIYDQLLMLRSHGWAKDLDTSTRESLEKYYNISERLRDFTFYSAGFNLRPTEINSFLGRLQIKRLDQIAEARNKRFRYYVKLLKEKFIVPAVDENNIVSCITFPFICKSKKQTDRVFDVLKNNNIETRPISGGSLGLQPIWKKTYNNYQHFNFADKLHERGFVLPCHPKITFTDITYICNLLLRIDD